MQVFLLILSIAGAVVSSFFLLPQLIKVIRRKSAIDLSMFSNIIGIIGAIVWILYLDLNYDMEIQKYKMNVILSLADWGILFSCAALLIYQVIWNKNNKELVKLKKEAKKMTNEELESKIKELKMDGKN